jgi:hypothetical protein
MKRPILFVATALILAATPAYAASRPTAKQDATGAECRPQQGPRGDRDRSGKANHGGQQGDRRAPTQAGRPAPGQAHHPASNQGGNRPVPNQGGQPGNRPNQGDRPMPNRGGQQGDRPAPSQDRPNQGDRPTQQGQWNRSDDRPQPGANRPAGQPSPNGQPGRAGQDGQAFPPAPADQQAGSFPADAGNPVAPSN